MGFRQADNENRGGYARVWKIENKGNYSVGQVSTSRKKSGSENEFEVDFQDGYVRFIGAAHEAISQLDIGDKGITIQITSCEVSNKYDNNTKKTYVNYAIFSFNTVDNGGNSSKTTSGKVESKSKKTAEPAEPDDELPF